MKVILYVLGITVLLIVNGWSQEKYKDKEKEFLLTGLTKPAGIEDRAAGTHNASNIGLFFENRGKLYPRRLSQGPSGEFPINSTKHYIYRINPMVGLPGNVIQGRYTSNEEWEAVGGYHNPDFTKIAFSDNPRTWQPDLGWPVKDADGNPVIKSDQDSYCVYNDANNGVKKTGIHVAQTGYAYGVKFAQNLLFFKYELTNQGNEDLDGLYFSIYIDCDIGNISGGAPEYLDDKIGFNKELNLLYFHDSGFSSEWPGGRTGQFGVVFLKTPEVEGTELGITDMHYNRYEHDYDIDNIQYAIMSSDTSFLESAAQYGNYFHPGPGGDLHYDDPATLPAEIDLLANASSGPYVLNRGDTLVFYTVLVAGNDHDHLLESVYTAYKILDLDFEASKPPATPTLSTVAGDGKVTLYWDDVAESSVDNFSGEQDFEGYRLYKSVDYGLHWDQYDRNVDPSVGIDPVPIADFDIINEIGVDAGLEYSYIDTDVINGFEYWYSLTAYDRGDSTLESLENSRGSNLDAINTVAVYPNSKAIERTAVSSGDVRYTGNGKSNYLLDVQPVDDDLLADQSYDLGFTYVGRKDIGNLKTQIRIDINDSAKTLPERYAIKFLSPGTLNLINLTTDEEIGNQPKRYVSGGRYTLNPGVRVYLTDPDPNAPADDLPEKDDYITINFASYAIKDMSDTILYPRTFLFDKPMTTEDGIIFTLSAPEMIQSVIRESGSDDFMIEFRVGAEEDVIDDLYFVSVENRGFDRENQGYISLLVRDSTTADILLVDTLYNGDEFEFNGIIGQVEFLADSPPSTGNVFSLTSIVPKAPNVQDSYQFGILGPTFQKEKIAQEIQNIKVVPNPYIVGALYEREFGELRREPIRQLKFINLPGKCTIHIFTIAGDLVKTIYHDELHGTATWDLRAEGNREIAPGIYAYVVKSDGEEFLSRFAVIK